MTGAAVLDSLEQFQAAAEDLLKHLDCDLGGLSDDEFVEVAREFDATRRQLVIGDYPIIREVEARSLPERQLARSAAGFLGQLWRLTPHEASARVREAAALGPRTTLTGESLDPLRPVVAEARRLGILGDAQVAVICKGLDALPTELAVEQVAWAEQHLVTSAHALNAGDLQKVLRYLHDALNPDGAEPSEPEQARRREIWLRDERDGMLRFGGVLDAGAAAKAQAWFGAMAGPRPEDATGRDERTGGQRRHDAFAELLDLGLRSDQRPSPDSPTVTLHLSMTAEQFESGTGHAVTSFGQLIRVPQALRLLDECTVAWAVHNSRGGIVSFGRSRRLASRDQADALLVRDGGCAFPSCDHPADWCERHHVKEWRFGGETDIDNLVLLCPYHHARFAQQNWFIEMRDGIPWFIPPPLMDPDQTPIRNIRGLGTGPVRQ